MKPKRNLVLWLGVGIPSLMIVAVAASIFIPGYFVKPQYNFVYSSGGQGYYYGAYYVVQSGRIVQQTPPIESQPVPVPKGRIVEQTLYLYDVKTNESRVLSLKEAEKFKLSSRVLSPDEFEVARGGGGGGFFPFVYDGGNYDTIYLKGHNVSRRLNPEKTNDPYSGSAFTFIGWIIP